MLAKPTESRDRAGTAWHPLLHWVTVLGSLGVVFFFDSIVLRNFSLSFFYLVPVTLATWFFGIRAGGCIALLATAARMLSGVSDGVAPAIAGWSAGMLLGILTTVTVLVQSTVRQRRDLDLVRLLVLGAAVGTVSGVVLAGIGAAQASFFESVFPGNGLTVTSSLPSVRVAATPSHERPASMFESLERRALHCLPLSRVVLLGSRNPKGKSCISPVADGTLSNQIPPDMGDLNGGPGTTVAMLLIPGRESLTTAMDDFRWHQSRLQQFLVNEQRINQPAWEAAEQFHVEAQALADLVAAAAAFPDELRPVDFSDESTWPGFCLCRLNEAVRNRDIGLTRRWSAELASASFWLVDLHRWLDRLVGNYDTALRFQKACPEPFRAIDEHGGRYDILSSASCLPAGMLTLHGRANFLEVERQAERIFHMPDDRLEALQDEQYISGESTVVPPARRANYMALANCLSLGNRRTLAAAARTPYECSFLINMLFRADNAGCLARECEVLRRFDQLMPNATVEQLMGVLFYRGHSFAGMEWGDRFHPRLVEEASALTGTSVEAFTDACRRADEIADRGGQYGATLTLRDALARGVFDCIRATDLAISLFRNSGRSGAGHIRWTVGTDAHAVAAHWGAGGHSEILVVDPMDPDRGNRWPDLYFGGASWPESLPGRPQPYAAELYVRGLDNYVWAEGYVIRGEHAGTLVSASIPYLTGFDSTGERLVFTGPFPAE